MVRQDFDALLTNHVVLRTDDVAVYHAYIAGMDGRHRREVKATGPASFEIRHASLGRIDIGIVHVGLGMTAESQRPASAPYLVQFPLTCGFVVEVDSRAHAIAPGAGAVISPGQHVRRTTDPGSTLSFSIPAELVRSQFEAHLGRSISEDLRFHPRITPETPGLLRYAYLLVDAIDQETAPPGGSLGRILEDAFINLLLETQPHSLVQSLASNEARTRLERIQAVERHLEHHLDEPVSVERLAEVAACSVRVLQTTFLDLCGLSPLDFVRRRRLAAARHLLESCRGAACVTEVAHRCGFSQLGRFSVAYREVYGESPSETRHRAAKLRETEPPSRSS